MQQKATVPMIVGALIVAAILIAMLAKTFMAPPAHNPDPPKFPDFIDPATGKPKGQQQGSGSSAPNTGPTGPPRGGAPGAPGG